MLNKGFVLILLHLYLFVGLANAQKKKTMSFFFDTDVSILGNKQKEVFSQFIDELDSAEIISISIVGYCDDRGREGYNDTLSIKRASYVKSLLVSKKINTTKVNFLTGNGKIDLINFNNIEEQRAYNRRVDLIIEYVNPRNLVSKNTGNSLLPDTLKVGDKIVLENVLFENSRSILLEESIPILEKMAELIKAKPQYNIAILGHICCNPPGKDVMDFETGEYNLSQARAKLIYDYLIYKGVDAKRLSYKGMMANFPLGKGEKNDRRVELQITGINP